MLMNYLFFLLPFFLYLGIALQGASFYLICIITPSLYFIVHKKRIPNYLIKVAFCLLLLHIIFPITSIINYLFPLQQFPGFEFNIELKWPSILQSYFPSYFFISAVFLFIFSYFNKKTINTSARISMPKVAIEPLKYFLTGLFPASILICLALIYQAHSGLDFHSIKGKLLEPTELLQNGRYRVNGFYGHPLTIAGVGLAYTVFAWSLLWLTIIKKNESNFKNLFVFKNIFIHQIALITISICNFIILILSSGRTAAISCVFMLIITVFILGIKKKPLVSLLTAAVVSISSYFVISESGLLQRIIFTTSSVTQNHSLDTGNNRQYFWKVYWHMFLDKPIVGHGNYWLKAGIRENYYDKLGYENLSEKYSAHNNYLEILACGGLFAFLWILAIIGVLYKTIKNKINTHKKELNYLVFSYLAMFLANLIHALTQNVYFDSSVVYIYTALIFVIIWHIAFKENFKT